MVPKLRTDADETETVNDPRRSHSGRKRLIRILIAGVLVLALFVAALPTMITVAGLHNVLFDQATAGHELSASAGSASLGWLSPVTLSQVEVKRDDKSWTVSVPSFSTEGSLLDVLLKLPDLGTITLDRPSVVLQPADASATETPDEQPPSTTTYPPLRAIIRDASVEIRMPADPEPVVAVDGISFVARTEPTSIASILIVEPVTVFDHRTLTPEICGRGLELIAPVLSGAAVVSGELTVELREFEMPISTVTRDDRVRLTKISGRLMLHKVETGLKSPLLSQIAAVLSAVAGGQFATVTAAEDTHVDFHVENGRVHHKGLTLLIPELSKKLTIMTSGWVDLDRNIDIRILVNLSGLATSKGGMLTSLMQTPLELRMTGTLKKPQVTLPEGRNLLDDLAGRLAAGDGSTKAEKPNVTSAISDLVGGLVGDSKNKPDARKTTRGIFDLIRSIQDKSDRGPQKEVK